MDCNPQKRACAEGNKVEIVSIRGTSQQRCSHRFYPSRKRVTQSGHTRCNMVSLKSATPLINVHSFGGLNIVGIIKGEAANSEKMHNKDLTISIYLYVNLHILVGFAIFHTKHPNNSTPLHLDPSSGCFFSPIPPIMLNFHQRQTCQI